MTPFLVSYATARKSHPDIGGHYCHSRDGNEDHLWGWKRRSGLYVVLILLAQNDFSGNQQAGHYDWFRGPWAPKTQWVDQKKNSTCLIWIKAQAVSLLLWSVPTCPTGLWSLL